MTRPGVTRMAIGVAASLAVHVAFVVGLVALQWSGVGGITIPSNPTAIEIVGVQPQASQPAPQPPPEPQPEPEKKPAEKPRASKPRAPRPKPPQAPQAPAEPDGLAAAPAPAADAGPPEPSFTADEPEVAPGVALDLPGAAPGDASLLVAFRLDRLRGTAWEKPAERILQPMPDYRSIMFTTARPVAELFDLLFIATPDPRDVTATFLAGHHALADADLEALLAGPVSPPRVTWEPVPGGTLGRRREGSSRDDPRVFLVPEPGWIVLARPEHLPGMLEPGGADAGPPARPRWMERLVALVGEPGQTGGPLAILAVTDLGVRLNVPGVGSMPSPAASIVQVFAGADGGLRVVGVFDFETDEESSEFAAQARKTKEALLASALTRYLVADAGAEAALAALQVDSRGKQVAASTGFSAADAEKLLARAGQLSEDYFRALRTRGR